MALQRTKTGYVLLAAVVIGVALRVFQYAASTSLWLDEIAVAQNVLDRSLWDLLTVPLSYDQTAPKGFLLAEKLAVTAFGPSDHALRLFPLLCALTGLVAFWRVAMRLLDERAAAVAVGLFAAAPPLVTYGAQVKQYSTDVAVTVLLLWLALALQQDGVARGRRLAAGGAGAIAVWFSQPAVLVITGVAASWVLIEWRERRKDQGPLRGTAPIMALWMASATFAAAAGLASLTPATRAYLDRFWASAFPAVPLRVDSTLIFAFDQLKALLGDGGPAGLAYPAPALYLALAAVGFLVLLNRQPKGAVLLLAPIGVAVLAAAARQFPFSDRLILFLVPSCLVAIAAGIRWIAGRLSPVGAGLGTLVVLALAALAVYPVAVTTPVYRIEDIEPVLARLRTSLQRPGDAVYVYYGAGPAVRFYGSRYGLKENDYVVGGCHRGESRRYLDEIDRFRGRARVWVIVTHALDLYRERDDIVRYLDTIGRLREGFAVPSRSVGYQYPPAEAFLFDLSDPARLSRAAAASFPLMGPSSTEEAFRCGEGPHGMTGPQRAYRARGAE
ncbi:MAG: glycosyltransferase family 39 protein [Deltaproteobacteria bacterium]|nr:glycosyltransferase family 39 protein [Deltaproteobacteria bacterium]